MSSFATIADLNARLGTPVTNEAQAQAFLNDATAYLQAELGQLIEAGTATFTTRHRSGTSPAIYLPQSPVRAITSVEIDGQATTAFDLIDQRLQLRSGCWPSGPFDGDGYSDITITFDYGYPVIPAEIVAWTCVLASQALNSFELTGSLGAGGLRSEQESIGSYSHAVGYATDAPAAFELNPEILDRLRARYGVGVYVTGT